MKGGGTDLRQWVHVFQISTGSMVTDVDHLRIIEMQRNAMLYREPGPPWRI